MMRGADRDRKFIAKPVIATIRHADRCELLRIKEKLVTDKRGVPFACVGVFRGGGGHRGGTNRAKKSKILQPPNSERGCRGRQEGQANSFSSGENDSNVQCKCGSMRKYKAHFSRCSFFRSYLSDGPFWSSQSAVAVW